ncbi:stalk domain-containing protein [Caldisericum sp. AR60]|uniref:stalk domain-containing protein n=1 Tax=Caldisericum sp. AR60 TaxID=3397852 RepID=UPI0039FCE9D4
MKKVLIILLALSVMFSSFALLSNVAAADSISINLSPNSINVPNKITITLTLGNAYVGANTQIEILIDGGQDQASKFSIPTSVSTSSIYTQISTTSYNVFSASISTSPVDLSKSLVIRTSTSFPNVNPNTTFSIVIDSTANFIPKTTGSHTIRVIVSGNYVVDGTFTVGTGGQGSPINIVSIIVDNPKLGDTSTYSFNFVPSTNLVSGDFISVEFPAGFTVPPTIDGRNFALKQGYATISDFSNNVSVQNNVVTLTIPPTQFTFNANYQTTLVFGAYTAIKNPTTAGQYTFKMWTSKQPTPATYTVTLGTSITNLMWDVNPKTAGAVGEHTISFKTSSSGALSTNDTITIIFPGGFTLPTTIPSGGILVNNVSAQASVSSNVLTIKCPTSIGAGSSVTIKILASSNFVNPPVSTSGYKIKVYTSQDQLQVESSQLMFTPSTLQNLKVTVDPQVVNKNASISFTFNLGLGGALGASDTISITFPLQFSVPNQVPSNLITITAGNSIFNPSAVSKSGNTLVLTLPQNTNIPSQSLVSISISKDANIMTPQTGGTYKFTVYTSKETTPIDVSIDVFAYPKSNIIINPQNPDGLNGYYITQPAISFSVSQIAGITPTLYYKINNGSYQTYDLTNAPKISIPEGKNVISFYSQDNFGNKEPENTKTILVDLTDPVITIAEPKENSVVVQPTFTLKGAVKSIDVANTTLLVNGKLVNLNSDGTFETLITLSGEGINTISIQAKSPSGRTSTKQFSVNYIARVTVFLQVGNDNAYINGEQVKIDAPPFIQSGNVMVPLRFILTSFKANLEWDGIFQIITLTLGNNRMRLQIGNLRADVNGNLKMLPAAPVLVKGVTFVPLRFISENFGADVKWDGTLKAVSIVYPKP